jgi:hypothetical protein
LNHLGGGGADEGAGGLRITCPRSSTISDVLEFGRTGWSVTSGADGTLGKVYADGGVEIDGGLLTLYAGGGR